MRLRWTMALVCAAAAGGTLWAADGKPLFNGKNLDGWEVIGDGQWTVMADGTVLGQRISDLRKQFVPGGPMGTPRLFKGWVDTQSWLYTKRNDFGEFDLHLEYWTKTTGNSGVSIRDTSRAKYGVITAARLHQDAVQDRLRDPDQQSVSGSASFGQHLRLHGRSEGRAAGRRLECDGHRFAQRQDHDQAERPRGGRTCGRSAAFQGGTDRAAAARSVFDHQFRNVGSIELGK